ncbi:hypothetical protein HQN88_20260 [Paenibacillus qinlingensis]|nr:hypothetical protein [Paenibacillus qinlingensis]
MAEDARAECGRRMLTGGYGRKVRAESADRGYERNVLAESADGGYAPKVQAKQKEAAAQL